MTTAAPIEPLYRYLKGCTMKHLSLGMYFMIGKIHGAYSVITNTTVELQWEMFNTIVRVSHRGYDTSPRPRIGVEVFAGGSDGVNDWVILNTIVPDGKFGTGAMMFAELVDVIVESGIRDGVFKSDNKVRLMDMLMAATMPSELVGSDIGGSVDDALQCQQILIEEYKTVNKTTDETHVDEWLNGFNDWIRDLRADAVNTFQLKDE